MGGPNKIKNRKIVSKLCVKCGKVLPLDRFYGHKEWASQCFRDAWCKDCAGKHCVNKESAREYMWYNNRAWSDTYWDMAMKKSLYALASDEEYLLTRDEDKKLRLQERMAGRYFFSIINLGSVYWMRTGAVTLLGDIAIVSKLADETGFTAAAGTQQYSPSIIDEVIKTGVIGVYYGAKVVNLVNPYLSDNVTPVIDTKRLYILPSAASVDMRPLKVLYEGDVQSTESTNIDDLAYEIRLDQFFGAGIVTGKTPAMSVYVDSTT